MIDFDLPQKLSNVWLALHVLPHDLESKIGRHKQSALPRIYHFIFVDLHSTCMLLRVNRHIDEWSALPEIVRLSFVDLHLAFMLPRVNWHIDKWSALPEIVRLSFVNLHLAFLLPQVNQHIDEWMALPWIVCLKFVDLHLAFMLPRVNWHIDKWSACRKSFVSVLSISILHLSNFLTNEWHCRNCSPRVWLSHLRTCHRWMQQPTELWKKLCVWRIRCWLYCLSQLMVASPLWLSMLSLLNCFVCLFLWIKSNDSVKFDFQQPGSDLEMHLHNLPKERLQSAPRAVQKLPLHPILSFSLLLNKIFKRSQFSFCLCN